MTRRIQALTIKQQHEQNRASREPTDEERAEYMRTWPNPGRRPAEIEYLLRTRRYRKPGDSGRTGGAGQNSVFPRFPPENSSYRCQGIQRNGPRAGLQCRGWACRGSRFCSAHGGANKYTKAYVARRGNVAARRVGPHAESRYRNLQRLPAVYSKFLSDSLASRLEDLVKRPLQEQINASQELGLMEIAAVDAVQLYDLTQEHTQKQLDSIETIDYGETERQAIISDVLQTRVAAGTIMKDTLQEVMNAREQLQRMASDKRTNIAVQDLALMIAQFVDIAYEVFGEEHLDLVREYAERLKQVKLPRDGVEGTSITPDMDVLAMDATVPKIEVVAPSNGNGEPSNGNGKHS